MTRFAQSGWPVLRVAAMSPSVWRCLKMGILGSMVWTSLHSHTYHTCQCVSHVHKNYPQFSLCRQHRSTVQETSCTYKPQPHSTGRKQSKVCGPQDTQPCNSLHCFIQHPEDSQQHHFAALLSTSSRHGTDGGPHQLVQSHHLAPQLRVLLQTKYSMTTNIMDNLLHFY